MKAHHPLGDPEIDGRVWPGRLSPRDDGRHDEALMPAPAHAELKVSQRVAEAGDVETSSPSRTRTGRMCREGSPEGCCRGRDDRPGRRRGCRRAAGRSKGPPPHAPSCGPAVSAARARAARRRRARAWRRDRARWSCGSSRRGRPDPRRRRPLRREWPPIYFDAECTTRSTPRRIGCWKTGVAQELSIIEMAPCAFASAARASTSWASMVQLVGLSM